MPDSIVKATLKEIEPLNAGEPVGQAARKVIEAGLPALPVVEDDGSFAGIFGEREFMAALFPAYVGTLSSARMVSRSIDETIERREACREEPIRDHLTTDHVLVEDDYSDTQLAELFLHHRVLIIPIATQGRVHAVVTRNDFFRALAEKLGDPIDEDWGE
ncbi:MAG TPA: CBS domain-containing protein [Solirubrobacterales bacterium]|nr:CBS domain-containing protein [Solirubrobacterales bacterium]